MSSLTFQNRILINVQIKPHIFHILVIYNLVGETAYIYVSVFISNPILPRPLISRYYYSRINYSPAIYTAIRCPSA